MGTIRGQLLRARTLGHRFFHHFGVHCATHQIRVILISGVVITSLLYPALAVYSSSQPRFLAHFSAQILDPFLTRDTASNYYAQHDLVDIWSVHESIRIREDSVARARCGIEQTLRIERIMIRGWSSENTSVLDQETLLAALELEKHLMVDLSSRGLCLRRNNGRCLAITPFEFWRHGEHLRAGGSVLDTMSEARNVTIDSAPIFQNMVFAGHDSSEAQFLVFTYFFPETDCLGDADHLAWRELLLNTTEPYAYPFSEVQEPRVIELTYATDESRLIPSPLTAFIALAYLAFAIWLFPNLRVTPPVHNPIGLIFTGIVEVMVSTITSLSACALVGFKITMLPWSIFPLVIMFIGAETMSNLVVAVLKTSIALPVKERIGEGLGRAGTSNSIKVLIYNVILGIIAFFAKGAIRQFCAFAVVVLVAHWFLVHTFFVAVLSIDLQRLELEELLQQNATETLAPKKAADSRVRRFGGAFGALENMLRGRAATNLSLLLLLAITATLYFATSPSISGNNGDLTLARHTVTQTSKLHGSRQSPAYHTWRLLNPTDEPRIHVRIESPTVLVLRPPGDAGQLPRDKPPHSLMRTLTWLFRIVVLPYAITLTALYSLLLYLLKDADRLEAQRNATEPDEDAADSAPPELEAEVGFDLLPRALGSDVELLAASADGNVVVAIGLASEAVVWIRDTQKHYIIETTDVLLRGASSSTTASAITALAVSDEGTEFAVGTGTGVVALWAIGDKTLKQSPRVANSATSAAVSMLCFANPHLISAGAAAPRSSRPPSPQPSMVLVAACENGVVTKWDTGALADPIPILPSHSNANWASLSKLQEPERVLAIFALPDGSLEVHDILPTLDPPLALDCRLTAGTSLDLPAKAHAAYVDHSGGRTLLLAAATCSGVTSVWDAHTAECVALLEDTFSQVASLRISAAPPRPCPRCHELQQDGFVLAVGIGPAVLAYDAILPTDARRFCTCKASGDATGLWGSTNNRRGRTASLTSNGNGTGRSRHPSVSEENTFPVSAHGGLSRRGSEKDLTRFVRGSSDSSIYLSVTLDGDEDDGSSPTRGTRWTGTAVRSQWKNLVTVRSAEAACERGAWDVADGRVIGVRKRARTAQQSLCSAPPRPPLERGLSAAARERWEVWTIEPTRLNAVSTACLSALRPADDREPAEVEEAPRLPFTRVAPLVAGHTLTLAGFGNTVGVFTFPHGSG